MPQSFDHCPHAILAQTILVTQEPVAHPDGPMLRTYDLDDVAGEISPDTIARRGCTISQHPAGDVVAIAGDAPPVRFDADWKAGTVLVEGLDEPMSAEDFARSYARCDSEGRIACSFLQPSLDQWEALSEAGVLAEHELDLRSMVDRRMDDGHQHDGRMYQIGTSGLTDGRSEADVLSAVYGGGPDLDGRHPVLSELSPRWMPITQIPSFRNAAVREVYQTFLEPYLDGAEIDDTILTLLETEDEAHEIFGPAARRVRTLPPFQRDNVLGGYRTSEPKLYEWNSLTVLVFSDFGCSYAYAWKPRVRPDFEAAEASVAAPREGGLYDFFMGHAARERKAAVRPILSSDPSDYAVALVEGEDADGEPVVHVAFGASSDGSDHGRVPPPPSIVALLPDGFRTDADGEVHSEFSYRETRERLQALGFVSSRHFQATIDESSSPSAPTL